MELLKCDTCSTPKPASQFGNQVDPNTCFRCRVSGVGLTIPALAADKESWRHDTIADSNRRTVRDARANGLDPAPVHTAAHSGPNASQLAKLKDTHLARPTKVAI